MSPDRRGQFVLAAAVVVAAALVAMTTAYVQLGYPADAAVDRADSPGVADARRTLDAAAYRAAAGIVDADGPTERAAADRVRRTLDAAVEELNAAGASSDRTYRIAGNGSAAAAVARSDCPGGQRRRFGSCRAVNGVVLQARLGTPVVVAVAVDVSVDGPGVDTEVTVVLRPYRSRSSSGRTGDRGVAPSRRRGSGPLRPGDGVLDRPYDRRAGSSTPRSRHARLARDGAPVDRDAVPKF